MTINNPPDCTAFVDQLAGQFTQVLEQQNRDHANGAGYHAPQADPNKPEVDWDENRKECYHPQHHGDQSPHDTMDRYREKLDELILRPHGDDSPCFNPVAQAWDAALAALCAAADMAERTQDHGGANPVG